MLSLNTLLSTLGYDDKSSHYYSVDTPPNIKIAHLFRAAREMHVEGKSNINGIYLIETSPSSNKTALPLCPVVYIAEAINEDEARQIHRKLWNLNYAPFLIVRLPHQIRVYTGFNYSAESESEGLLDTVETKTQFHRLLSCLAANVIDSGGVWSSEYGRKIKLDARVDERLLKNLRELGVVLKNDGLSDEVAHALIGKYVYLSYLRDRNILSNNWLKQQQIDHDSIFTHNASIASLQKLVEILEKKINGKIFPINFQQEETLKDEHISWVASVFRGDEFKDVPKKIQQLYLPFRAYDFQYIPVETFSAIYEQFIYERKKKGAIYTPEVLADYLLSEIEGIKPLHLGMKIFDPACGSGIFLVLTYRRLIEKELYDLGKERLHPAKLCDILQGSLYGVEREQDACYITEFSLILTLLHYSEPRELEKLEFKLPNLHNTQIFCCDFFDIDGQNSEIAFWQRELKFDWIVGNPPWISSSKDERDRKFAHPWIKQHALQYPVGSNSVAEAFSWLVTELLSSDGIVGLILKATSLFNIESQRYRQHFFTNHQVRHITNFSNLREALFSGRATFPAITFVYQKATDSQKPEIIHYSPFSVNQHLSGIAKKIWVLTVNENEIQAISPYEAEKGDASFWKLALWGTHFDKRAIDCIQNIFPIRLGEFCERKKWYIQEGSQLRNERSKEKLKHIPQLEGKNYFGTKEMLNSFFRFSIPKSVFRKIPKEECYLRRQGGEKGLKVTYAPHIILSPSWQQYITYSEHDFVVPPRQIGISTAVTDSNILKALCVYLNSSIAAYYLFFHVREWGISRQAKRVTTGDVKKIPVPSFSEKQINELAVFYDYLVKIELEEISDFILTLLKEDQPYLALNTTPVIEHIIDLDMFLKLTRLQKNKFEHFVYTLRDKLQQCIDDTIFKLFDIPEDIRLLVTDFFQVRLPLDTPSAIRRIIKEPEIQDLLTYARTLRDMLDDFVMGETHHRITITASEELIECVIEITKETAPIPIDRNSITTGDVTTAKLLSDLSINLRSQISQWVYVQRGLRLFDGAKIYFYKTPRLINWTRTQALIDANDIIGEALSA